MGKVSRGHGIITFHRGHVTMSLSFRASRGSFHRTTSRESSAVSINRCRMLLLENHPRFGLLRSENRVIADELQGLRVIFSRVESESLPMNAWRKEFACTFQIGFDRICEKPYIQEYWSSRSFVGELASEISEYSSFQICELGNLQIPRLNVQPFRTRRFHLSNAIVLYRMWAF